MSDIHITNDSITKGLAIALGNFDGLHLGHQDVFNAAKAAGDFAIVSFDPHPRRFFDPSAPAFELANNDTTIRIGKSLGAKAVHFIRFDKTLSLLSPEEFLASIAKTFEPSLIAVGEDFTFGARKVGNTQFLQDWCAKKKIKTAIVPLKFMGEKKISSTEIRNALNNGDPKRASALLGRAHMIEGVVTQGDQRGRDLGFPTANLYPTEIMLPKFGIYATRLEILTGARKGQYLGASSLGVRPSFGINKPNFETHILDFEGDIYGENIRVELIEYLRPEVKFEGVDKLIIQMQDDVKKCREILNA